MEAKFYQTKRLVTADIAAHALIIIVCAFTVGYFKNAAAYVLAVIAIIITDLILYTNYSGKIIADENGITVIKTFWGRKVGEKFIEYSEVQDTDCGIEPVWNRLITTQYVMELTLKMRDGSKIVLMNTMKIGTGFPATEPEKYKQYLHEQPLMKISHYIDSKLHLNASA